MLAFLRMFFASVILGLLTFRSLKIDKADYYPFALVALTGVTVHIALFFFGLKLAPAINAALLTAAVPLFTLLAAHVYLKEKLNTKLIISSLLALSGVLIIIGKPDHTTTLLTIVGNILLLLSALSWVGHEILAKKLFVKYKGSTVAFYTMAIGAVSFIPFALLEHMSNPLWYQKVSTAGFLGILYGIFLASLVAYWAWQTGLSKLPAGQASFFFYLDPISGAILAMLLLGEKMTTNLAIGGLLITIGVILAEQKRRSHPLMKRANSNYSVNGL